ncbi:unnamed protein product [Prorocentrum cordatum]|uniref:Exocyst complex component Sec6 n=1 Tax=Prorocentrum cordatum TaxID=2364126 RepID=A0ABN9Q261_9DINO|nr:unnamed protein product [Polarella glacialis]
MTVFLDVAQAKSDADVDDEHDVPDSASVASGSAATTTADTARGIVGKSGATRASKNPTYWIKKLTFENALGGTTDRRDMHHAAECANRYELKFKDDTTTDALRRHMKRVTIFNKLSPKEVPQTSWPTIRDAFSDLILVDVSPPGKVFLALVEKRAVELSQAATSSMCIRESDMKDLVSCATPWPLKGDQHAHSEASGLAIFDVLHPKVHPMAPILPGSLQAGFLKEYIIKKFLCHIITTTTEANVNSTMAAFAKLMEFLDLPDDAEISNEAMGVCDSIYVSVRGFGAIVNIQVGVDTKFEYVKDAMALHKAAEKTVVQSVLHDVGTTLNRNPFLSEKMDMLAKNFDEYMSRGPQLQMRMKALSDLSEQTTCDAIITCVNGALGWNNQYSAVLPEFVCGGLDELIHRKTKLLYDLLVRTSKGAKDDGDFSDFLTSAQTLYQNCWRTYPETPEYDAYIDDGWLDLTAAVSEKVRKISEDVMQSLPLLDELAAILRQKAGLLDGGEFDGTDHMIETVTTIFHEFGKRSLIDAYRMLGLCERAAEVTRAISTVKGGGDRAQVLAKLSSSLTFTVDLMKQVRPNPDNESHLVASEALELNTALRLSRNARGLQGSLKALASISAESAEWCDKFAGLACRVLVDAGSSYFSALKDSAATLIANLGSCAAAKMDETESWIQSLPPQADGWNAFVTSCQKSLMKCDVAETTRLLRAAEIELEKHAEGVNVFGSDSEDPKWNAMASSIEAARITLSAQRLMEAYLSQETDKPALRSITKNEINAHAKWGIEKNSLPEMLVKRMQAAMKLQTMG